MNVVVLAGGTGSAKLLRGLARIAPDLTVVANVGDNFWFHGLYVCPDVDVAMYTLAGLSDRKKGWGIDGDTFNVLRQLSKLGLETWFKLGDIDMATSLLRTQLLARGKSLTEVTKRISEAFGLHNPVLPATDSAEETRLITKSGSLHLQEYWVRDHGRPRVFRVHYKGARSASPTKAVKRALAGADKVILCPANPITSVGPILAINGMRKLLSDSKAEVVALSPMVGSGPFSGPAGRLMKQLGLEPDSLGVASLYADLVHRFVIDRSDASQKPAIERLGMVCEVTSTLMRNGSDEERIAAVLLKT